jgi:hypothetical protein
MKRALAILFSLALVWAQAASLLAGDVAASAKKCPACSCQQAGCCSPQSAPTPQPTPAAPAPAAAKNLSPALTLLATAMATWPNDEAKVFPTLSPLSSKGTRVPLYTRNCSFLI